MADLYIELKEKCSCQKLDRPLPRVEDDGRLISCAICRDGFVSVYKKVSPVWLDHVLFDEKEEK